MIRQDFTELDQDLQEAHSWRYGEDAIAIVRLSSGRFAVLAHMRVLFAIVDTLEEAATLEIPKFEYKPREVKQKRVVDLSFLKLEL